MAASNHFFATSSPVALPPTQPDQLFANGHLANGTGAVESPDSTSHSFAPNGSALPPSGSLAGRKRSRGDIHALDEEDEPLDDGSVPTPVGGDLSDARGWPLREHGMPLIHPDDPGYGAAAERQSGVGTGEQARHEPFDGSHTKRPSFSSRKSKRVDVGTAGSDDLAQLVLPPQMRDATTEPLIDEATRMLGISWTRMDATEALRINQAAYSKWIQNHYPGLMNVAVWFENSAIPGYLAQASNAYNSEQGYYIFSHDLTEARLVTTEAPQLIPRLKMLPALHLAAPGGHIRAETDPIATPHDAVNGVTNGFVNHEATKFSQEVSMLRGHIHDNAHAPSHSAEAPEQTNGTCCAHEMELD